MTDSCMSTKNKLAELAYSTIKNLLLVNINGIEINETILSLKNSTDPLGNFLKLEIFLDKLNYFDLTVTLRDCRKIDIERMISNSRNEIKSLVQEDPGESVEKIFDKYSSEERKKFKK